MNKVKIFTHTDLDGIAGAALYLYCNNLEITNTNIVFVEPSQIHRYIDSKDLRNSDKVVLIDLGINSDFYNVLINMDLKDIKIEWYDHHIWEKDWIDELNARGIKLFIDTKTCASGVVANILCNDNIKAIEFADIVCDIDLWLFRRWESNFLYRYIEIEDSDSWRYNALNMFLKTLRDMDFKWLIENSERYVEEYVDKELNELSRLCSKIHRIKINGIDIAIYIKHHRVPGTSIIGNFVLNRCKSDIAVIINEKLKSISFRSNRYDVRDIARRLGGGGHLYASGAPLNINLLQKILFRLSKGLLVRYVASELKRIKI